MCFGMHSILDTALGAEGHLGPRRATFGAEATGGRGVLSQLRAQRLWSEWSVLLLLLRGLQLLMQWRRGDAELLMLVDRCRLLCVWGLVLLVLVLLHRGLGGVGLRIALCWGDLVDSAVPASTVLLELVVRLRLDACRRPVTSGRGSVFQDCVEFRVRSSLTRKRYAVHTRSTWALCTRQGACVRDRGVHRLGWGTDRQTGRPTDRPTDRSTNRQTDR